MAIYLYSEDFADRFNAEQGLPDSTLVELNDTTTWMTEFVALFVGNPVEEHDMHDSDFYNNGYGVLKDAIVAYAEEELNGMFEFYMEYDSEGVLVDELKEERIIKAKAQDKLGYQLFRIYSVTKNHDNDNIIVSAQHITYDLANNYVEELHASSATKRQVMELIGNSTVRPHPFTISSTNDSTVSSTRLYRTNPLQMIAGMNGSVLQIWGGQIERDNFRIVMHDRRGSDDGVSVTYEKNITGLEATVDISGLVTRIHPFVKIEASDGAPERLIELPGKYIDSPLINAYSQVYIKPLDLSSDERIDTEDKTDAQIRSQIQAIADSYFVETNNDKPKATMDVSFAHLWETEEYKDVAPLELVGMGDTVSVRHSKLDVDATAIVNYIRYDCIAEVNEEVKLGSVKARFSESINRVERLEDEVKDVKDDANKAIISANGKNTTYYGPDEPTGKLRKGDLWFRIVDGVYTRTYRFDGIEWQLVLDMDSREAQVEAEAARDRADSAYNRAGDAISDAQSAFDEAQEALSQSNNAFNLAQSGFNKAQSNANVIEGISLRIEGVEGDYTSISGTVQGLQTRVSNAENDISSVTQLANGLQTQVADVSGNVSTLQQTSSSLYRRIESAEARIDTIDTSTRNLITHLQDNWEYGYIDNNGQNVPDAGNVRTIDFYPIDANQEYTLSSYYYHEDGVLGTGTIYLYDENKEFLEKHQHVNLDVDNFTTFTTPGNAHYYRVTFTSFEQPDISTLGTVIRIKLIKGNEITDWSPSLEDTGYLVAGVQRYVSEFEQTASSLANRISNAEGDISHFTQTVNGFQTRVENAEDDISSVTQLANTLQTRVGNIENGTASVITQLNNNINARVVKGDVINQINISDENILISGRKLLLDGNTTVNGSFKVTNANIISLDAGKITTGILDAADVSIINLNVNRLVGNYASFVSEGFNSIGSQVKISSTGLSTYSNGLRSSLLNGNGHRFYRNGIDIGYIGTQQWLNDSSYRGLAFGLEYGTDYMAWGRKLTSSDPAYSTMLSWHRTSAKANKGFTFNDEVTFDFDFKLAHRGYTKSYTNAVEWGVRGSNYNITQFDNGQIQFFMGSSTPTHTFFPSGTKSGGSIKIGNETLGMSPVDSPQILIEYVEFDIDLSSEGTIVYLDEEYIKAVSNYAVFLNNGEVIEKAEDYFVVVGEGLADARIVGKRIEYEEAFWGDMKSLEKPQKENETQMRAMSMQNTQDDKIKGFWKRRKARKTIHEEVNGKTMKKIYREG